ncbi:hypothetical protein [Methylocystis sp. JR02]|nr:hypothetical protein [Methylocystis sp. JR02]MDJ0447115.1 hypothetical protein [Methylocystis sp. JR02]
MTIETLLDEAFDTPVVISNADHRLLVTDQTENDRRLGQHRA